MKVFVVEDSALIRECLRDMLVKIPGIELAGEVDNESDAVQSICALQPDLVILDFSLASGTGLGVLRRIRTRALPIRVVVLTNDIYPQYRKKCINAGADYFMDKSRDIVALGGLLSVLADVASRESGVRQDGSEHS